MSGDVKRAELRLTIDVRCTRCKGGGLVDWRGAGGVVVLRALCECVEPVRATSSESKAP